MAILALIHCLAREYIGTLSLLKLQYRQESLSDIVGIAGPFFFFFQETLLATFLAVLVVPHIFLF